jgi:CRISPR-associated protein (TIGR02584 family)
MNDQLPPQQTVLLSVIGMSPAVLTETVWSLCSRAEPLIPDRIVVVTTSAGAVKLRDALFRPLSSFGGRCVWQALRDSLQGRGCEIGCKLRFGETSDDIRVITALDNETGLSFELEDIRSQSDNEAVGDYLLDQVRMFTGNPDIRLVASLAGGRKTMGALLYACMTLSGRGGDVLTHVLVNQPFESAAGFYFPGQPLEVLDDSDGNHISAEEASIDCAEVPFISMRNLFSKELGRQVGSFSQLMESCSHNLNLNAGERVRLSVETRRTYLEVNGQRLRLTPREHLLFLFIAYRAKQSAPAFPYYSAALDAINEFRTEMVSSASEGDFGDWRHEDRLKQPFEEHDLSRIVSDLRRKIQALQGESSILSGCLPEKGRFSLEVTSSLIEIRD